MNVSKSNPARVVGLLIVLAGVCLNERSLGWMFAADGIIEAETTRTAVLLFQGLVVLGGILFVLGIGTRRLGRLVRQGLGAAALVAVVVGAFGWARTHGWFASAAEKAQRIQIARMLASETLHLNLNAERLGPVNRSLANLAIPSGDGAQVFADEVLVVDLAEGEAPVPQTELSTVGTVVRRWPVEEQPRTVPKAALAFLAPLLGDVRYLEDGAKIYFDHGDFVGEDRSVWEVHCGLHALARRMDGTWSKVHGALAVRWELAEGLDPEVREDFQNYGAWFITQLRLESLETFDAPRTFFTEELAAAVPDPASLDAARRNLAQEQIVARERYEVENGKGSWKEPHPFWGHQAAWRNPSVSVVDLNRDGFDDFYAMARYGKNMFFQNNGDGTFTERAAEIGLDVEDHTDVAIFADFDNDGDDDAFLGRTIARSMYFENEGGVFHAAPDRLGGPLPFFAVTASAVDYDGDGLLDLFVGTYAAQILGKDLRRRGKGEIKGQLLPDYLPEQQARHLFELYREAQKENVRDRVGPPNLLYHNVGGGKFEAVTDSPLLLYRNTYQATFADYDNDGDADVYVANDFAPNNMFRNDGGSFTDITEETNARDIGFGMGVTWGDFDKDGDQDAYISNMYSKAGNRILPMVEAVDDDFRRMAAGNSLLRLQDGAFDRISTLDDSGMQVEMGGWSWGSQWVDFDNDSWLDLFVLSGYYSAPREIRAGHDL